MDKFIVGNSPDMSDMMDISEYDEEMPSIEATTDYSTEPNLEEKSIVNNEIPEKVIYKKPPRSQKQREQLERARKKANETTRGRKQKIQELEKENTVLKYKLHQLMQQSAPRPQPVQQPVQQPQQMYIPAQPLKPKYDPYKDLYMGSDDIEASINKMWN